jgi:tRNA threonylcarbamoyladenosine biosynthesis protein TsaE
VNHWLLETRSPEETFAFGSLVGGLLEPGHILLLDGNLGAGKTLLVRGVAAGAGISEDELVSSPTFTLLNEYHCRIILYHFDLYRLTTPYDVIELGFEETVGSGGAVLVEWPDRLGDLLRGEGLWFSFTLLDESRRSLRLEASDSRHAALLGKIAQSSCKKMF